MCKMAKTGLRECDVCNNITHHVDDECQECQERKIANETIIINVPFHFIDQFVGKDNVTIDGILDSIFDKEKQNIKAAYEEYKNNIENAVDILDDNTKSN